MSTEFGIALCALIGVVALVFGLGTLKIRVTDLESETKLLYKLSQSQEKYIDTLAKCFEKEIRRIEREDKQ